MTAVCVIGDSFCACRDEQSDWPLHLANLLKFKLTGIGLPGQSWWSIRKQFLQICNSKEFDSIDFFVFCHSEPHRIISSSNGTINVHDEKNRDMLKFYLTDIQNFEFNNWCCIQWFKELNSLLVGKKVIHIQNFSNTSEYFDTLNGIKILPNLHKLSLSELDNTDTKSFMRDTRRNHFNTENNVRIADFLYDVYINHVDNWQNCNKVLKL
jgi:hypothetical protein